MPRIVAPLPSASGASMIGAKHASPPPSLGPRHGLGRRTAMIGLFATRPLSDLERASVHRAAARLDFTGECRRDVWDDEHLIVVRAVSYTHLRAHETPE